MTYSDALRQYVAALERFQGQQDKIKAGESVDCADIVRNKFLLDEARETLLKSVWLPFD